MGSIAHQKRLWTSLSKVYQAFPDLDMPALEEVLSNENGTGAAVQDVQKLAYYITLLHEEAKRSWWRKLLGM